MPRPVATSSQSRWILLGVLAIGLLSTLVYWPALHGGFILDDDLLLTESKLIKAPDGLFRIWFTTEPVDYWPVTNTSLWIEWRLWGLNPTGYHITNLALHIAAALLIWLVLRRLSIPGAFLAALLFAVHPVNVESVAWISQRKGLLAIVFFLLSIYFYLRRGITRSQQNGIKFLESIADWSLVLAQPPVFSPRHAQQRLRGNSAGRAVVNRLVAKAST